MLTTQGTHTQTHTLSHLVNSSQHLRATGHPGHGLDEDIQILLEPLDDLHGLVVVLTQRSQGLGGEKRDTKEEKDQKKNDMRMNDIGIHLTHDFSLIF